MTGLTFAWGKTHAPRQSRIACTGELIDVSDDIGEVVSDIVVMAFDFGHSLGGVVTMTSLI